MKNKLLLSIILSISLIYCLFIFHTYPAIQEDIFNYIDRETIIKTCTIPKLNPFDKSILQFIKKPDNINCSQNGPLVDSDTNYLFINEHLLPAYGVNNKNELNCCYQAFKRRTPIKSQSDNEIIHIGDCKSFSSKTKIGNEFVEVSCKFGDKEIYRDMHNFVPIKQNRNKFANTKQKLNVLIFGIDSLSHMNFQRQMPKTKKLLDENLNSILMLGYNKNGDNTYPNLMPILTGHSIKEIEKLCLQIIHKKFDDCHFIWDDYSNAGYLTAFAEDSAFMSLFNLNQRGFQVQPTHYYWRTFCLNAEKQLRKGYCIGPRQSHKILIDYAKKFTLSLKDEPFFGFFWSVTLSHDCLNCPSLSDDDYVDFFVYLKTENILNNTVVIFLSDHGIRTGSILETYQGYMEVRLPFLYFIFPPWFYEQYPIAIKNMKNNANMLISNFDIHETLLDLLDVENLKIKYTVNNTLETVGKRGLSLFSHFPDIRTCEMAGIPSHWCTCKKIQPININDANVKNAANFIVSHTNKLLMSHKKCATLKLDSIQNATVTKVKIADFNVIREYTIILKTKPSDALFESTVRCFGRCYTEDSFEISGVVSRLNRYENQSSCIDDHLLRMYCYCI